MTATPIQNNLTELWGFVQYVEPTGTLLGNLRTFRDVFCDGDDRTLVQGQDSELRRRIETVVKRTLRRQAQEFLERPFVDRRAQIFEYSMTQQEKSLYDDVTAYLLEPQLLAFRGNQRRLLLIGFHRLMASSVPALANSLKKVAERLSGMLAGQKSARESWFQPTSSVQTLMPRTSPRNPSGHKAEACRCRRDTRCNSVPECSCSDRM